MQRALEQVHVSESIEGYIVDLVAATRAIAAALRRRKPARQPRAVEARTREGGVGGRDFVVPEDVKAIAIPALAHRLTLRPELWVQRVRGEDVDRGGTRDGADAAGRGRARSSGMTRVVSPRLGAYAGLAGIGLLAGLVLGRVELIALAAPFALAAVAGGVLAREPELEATLALDRERALEDEIVTATIELSSTTGADRVEVLLHLPRGAARQRSRIRAPSASHRARPRRSSCRCAAHGSAAFVLGPLLRPLARPARVHARGRRASATESRYGSIRASRRSTRCSLRTRRRRTSGIRSRARRAKASSSPTSASGCPATAFGRSTGAQARGTAAACS